MATEQATPKEDSSPRRHTMNPTKAIDLIQDIKDNLSHLLDQDDQAALQLSIEALELIAREPCEGYTCIPRPLPGETKD